MAIESARHGADLYLAVKVCLDKALTVIILVASSPLVLAAMVLVKLTSRGPVIYTQTRLGLGDRPYTMYKIRTMVQDCERSTGPLWSSPRDPRVTPVGRFLRASHLDEFPQLWNVLRGEMSLVGPRPERPEIAAQIEISPQLSRYRERTAVRPGLTGLAQIQLPPDHDIESVRRKLACDLYYVQCQSMWLDLRILISTATGVLGIPFGVFQRLLSIPRADSIEYVHDHEESTKQEEGEGEESTGRGVCVGAQSPRLWNTLAQILPRESRVRVFEPAHQETLENYVIACARHKRSQNHFWIKLYYTAITVLMVADCLRTLALDKVLRPLR